MHDQPLSVIDANHSMKARRSRMAAQPRRFFSFRYAEVARPIWSTRFTEPLRTAALAGIALGADAGFPSAQDTQARMAPNVENTAIIPIRITSSSADITPSKLHRICNANTLRSIGKRPN